MRHGRITARAVGYWVSTGLLAFQFLLGGLMSVRPASRTLAVVHIPGPRSTERAELQTTWRP